MRKIISIALIGILVGASANAAMILNWYSDSSDSIEDGGAPDVLDQSGDAVPKGTEWYIQLYDVDDTTWDFATNTLGGEVASNGTAGEAASSPFQLQDGVAYLSKDIGSEWSNVIVGTRLFNDMNVNNADAYAISTLTFELPTISGTTKPQSYNFGDIRQEDWVPEPMTTMLALVGVGTVIYRRRRMRNK